MNQKYLSKHKEIFISIGCIFFGLFFSFVFFEAAVRVFELFPNTHFLHDRPTIPEKMLEYREPIKSLILHHQLKRENEFRVIALGDSFTFGPEIHQDDAYPARLERILNHLDRSNRFSIFNFGVRGYSTAQELNLLKNTYKKVAPNLVLLQITLNDPELVPYRVTHPYLDAHGRVKLTNPIFTYLHSLKLVVQRILNAQTYNEHTEYYSKLFNNPVTYFHFKKSIQEIKRLLVANNIDLAAVVFPLFSNSLSKSYPFIECHNKIHEILNTEGIPFIDILHRFQRLDPSRLQVFPGVDSHPNEIAHRIAADKISLWLMKKHIIPIEFESVKSNLIKHALILK
jgi:hypothetical protein